VAPRCVVLGVSGGIAAYKAVEICRRLGDAGFRIAPVLTEAARRFVGPVTFSAVAAEPARWSLWDDRSPIPHTELGQRAELVVVAPATADLLARYAGGMADDLLTATLLATRAPVIVCPAMHTEMWEHPAVRHNLEVLRGRGVTVLPPATGRLAGGDEGVGRLADPEMVVDAVKSTMAGTARERDLTGARVVVSAGGTREPIDPVRYITNRSSGKQGHALAEVAARRGATVHLVTTSSLGVAPDVSGVVDVEMVETAAEMEDAVLRAAPTADAVIMAAAVADFRPKAVADEKLRKEEGVPELVLEATTDILSALAQRSHPGQVLVGFAAETGGAPVERASAKLVRKGVDVLVVNDVLSPEVGFDHDTNAVVILEREGTLKEIPLTTKETVAEAVLDTVVRRRGPSQTSPR
jgi:phosphopantothenoylcysteine decarboxylase / phosphopantothenate---cysteine ligase